MQWGSIGRQNRFRYELEYAMYVVRQPVCVSPKHLFKGNGPSGHPYQTSLRRCTFWPNASWPRSTAKPISRKTLTQLVNRGEIEVKCTVGWLVVENVGQLADSQRKYCLSGTVPRRKKSKPLFNAVIAAINLQSKSVSIQEECF